MILTQENIAHYLLGKNLITLSEIIEGRFTVHGLPSRNSNFIINKKYKNSYFVKQVASHSADKIATLKIEATIYWLLKNDEYFGKLTNILPTFFEYDYINHILIIEFLDEYKPISPEILIASKDFKLIRSVVKGLGAYHAFRDDFFKQKSKMLFKEEKPWIFNYFLNETNLSLKSSLNNADHQMFHLINENKRYLNSLKDASQLWEANCLIHGDLKFTNILFNDKTDHEIIKLIDWELAIVGDYTWDIASILAGFIAEHIKEDGLSKQGCSIIISTFWKEYKNSINLDSQNQNEADDKVIKFIALKLVHTAMEVCYNLKTMPLYAAKLLQSSQHFIENTNDIKVDYFKN